MKMFNKMLFESRKFEIDAYLRQLYQMHIHGGLNDAIIYNLLKIYSLKTEDFNETFTMGANVENLFEIWKNRFENKKNTFAFRDMYGFPYFFQFVSKDFFREDSQFTKFYIPLDKEHLEDGVNLIFDFLDKNNISHCSKVSKEVRSDNVIIRINKKDTVARDKILKFLNKNKFINSGLNKPNPFVPMINGIGIMDEHGNSYNREISYYIYGYLEYAKENGLEVSANQFRHYLKYCEQNKIRYDGEKYINHELFLTFDTAFFGQKEELSYEQKEAIFMDTLNDVFDKKGLNGVNSFLSDVLFDGNYSNIAYDEENKFLINSFISDLDKKEMLNIINGYVSSLGFDNSNLELSISIFTKNIFKERLSSELSEICNATLSKYGKTQLRRALYVYLFDNSADYFTRGGRDRKYNYRDRLLTIDRGNVFEIIFDSLKENGISYVVDNVDDYMDKYIDLISNSGNNLKI